MFEVATAPSFKPLKFLLKLLLTSLSNIRLGLKILVGKKLSSLLSVTKKKRVCMIDTRSQCYKTFFFVADDEAK
jgi:hypothetical protein